RPETRHRIPAGRGRVVVREVRKRRVVPGRHVEEVARVSTRARADLVERRIDQPQTAAVQLVGDRDEPGPLWRPRRRAADNLPAGAARRTARGPARGTTAAPGWQREVDEHARP